MISLYSDSCIIKKIMSIIDVSVKFSSVLILWMYSVPTELTIVLVDRQG